MGATQLVPTMLSGQLQQLAKLLSWTSPAPARLCVGWDAETGSKLREITLFRSFINPWIEECVQWVFIKELRIVNGKLIVLGERDRAYCVDLKTRAVLNSLSSAKAGARSWRPIGRPDRVRPQGMLRPGIPARLVVMV